MRYLRLTASVAVLTSALLAALAAPFPAGAQVNSPVIIRAGRVIPALAVPAQQASRYWTVRPGQTLSAIAAAAYGSAALWPALWWVNKARVRNPDLITAGQVLRLSAWHPQADWLYRAGKAADGPVHVRQAVRVAARGDRDGDRDQGTPGRLVFRAQRHAGSAPVVRYGVYSFAALERLWTAAGGPGWAAPHAAEIAECESGGRVNAHNPSGATGLWQILGPVVPGNLYDPFTNALNAVAKFRASGDTFAQWVCK